MRSAIAVIMAILGTILVLSGAAALWASALVRPRLSDPDPAPSTGPGAAGLGSTAGSGPVAGVGSAPGTGPGSSAGSGVGSSAGSSSAASRRERALDRISRVPAPDRLIIWGVVLLALSAVAAGAIQVAASASAGNQ